MANKLIMVHKRQKEITDRIRKAGLNPTQFEFNPISNKSFDIHFKAIPEFRMMYKRTGNGNQVIYVAPWANHEMNQSVKFTGFEDSIKVLESWLSRVKENLDIGNPWEEIQEFKDEVFGDAFDSYEEMLDDVSAKMLDAKLTKLLEYFVSKEIDVTEMKEDVAFLKEEAKRSSRRSLRNQFIGIVCSWFLSGWVPTEIVPEAWDYVKQLFSSIRFIKLS